MSSPYHHAHDKFSKAFNLTRTVDGFQEGPQTRGFFSHIKKKPTWPVPTPPPYCQSPVASAGGIGVCNKCKQDLNDDPTALLESRKCGHDLCKGCYAMYYAHGLTGCAADGCVMIMDPGEFCQLKMVNGASYRVPFPDPPQTSTHYPSPGPSGQHGFSGQSQTRGFDPLFSYSVWSSGAGQYGQQAQWQQNPPCTPHQPQDSHFLSAAYSFHQGQSRGYYEGHPQSPDDAAQLYPTPSSTSRNSFVSTQNFPNGGTVQSSPFDPTPAPFYNQSSVGQYNPSAPVPAPFYNHDPFQEPTETFPRPQRASTYDNPWQPHPFSTAYSRRHTGGPGGWF